MPDADMKEVFKRLAEREARFLDENHKEMPLPLDHWGEEPLFMKGQNDAH